MRMHDYCAPLMLGIAGMLAPGVSFAADAAKPDVAGMWRAFLATGEYAKAIAAFDVLPNLGYTGETVDPVRCTSEAAALDAALEAAPVSIALRRAAYLCAAAGTDSAAAERALEMLAALSRHALKQAGDPRLSPPIPIVAPVDGYALLMSSGWEPRYEYYAQFRPERHFPLVIVGWDEEAKVERHLAFDYVNPLLATTRDMDFHGMPVMRTWLANAFVQGRSLASVDLSAVRAAGEAASLDDKVAKLRAAAANGGILSAGLWLMVCGEQGSSKRCGEGLVDALLPQAEKKQALPMALLAVAQFEGIGTKADPKAAWRLLDAAERRWPLGGALIHFADLWESLHGDAALPKALVERIERAPENRALRMWMIQRSIRADKPHLEAGDVAFLQEAAQNELGLGYGALADYYEKLGQEREYLDWTVKAAKAGSARHQALYASALLFGDHDKFVPVDRANGQKLATEAAQGGDAWAARWLSHESFLAGDRKAAEGWLLGPAAAGDLDAAMRLAELYAEEWPELSGDATRAIEIYRMISDIGDKGATARRELAELALKGIGMPRDTAQAMAWLKPDAERGDTASQIALGAHYLEGDFGARDEAEGARWLDRAIKAGDRDAMADYGSWLFYKKNTPQSRAQGMDMLARADAEGNKGGTNNYAWMLCTSPLKEVYDPKRGLEVSKRLGEDMEEMPAGWVDTVAACYAANGDFVRAVELQTRAVKEMNAYESPRVAKERNGKESGRARRLGLYKAGKRYEELEQDE
ncbi:hypothetical protein GCM10027431_19360 [Lysobacter rhizosphaerae]